MTNVDSVVEALKVLREINNYNKICELTEEQLEKYKSLLLEVKKYNKISEENSEYPNIKNLKGKALEKLVTYLLNISGGIFEVYEDIRTETNQIDQFVKLNLTGKALKEILPFGLQNNFIVECKNHKTSVGVEYIGKFCSLMITTNIKLGLFFTCNGISGNHHWDESQGLIRKFYLSKEREEDRHCIIDFNIEDFEKILNGENFLSLLEKKIDSLRLDTKYKNLLSKHPVEEKIDIEKLKNLENQ